MKFYPIERDGTVPGLPVGLPEEAYPVLGIFSAMYDKNPYLPPWIGYIAVCEGAAVGTCAFKTAPLAGRAEIAYFTFSGFEGKGYATQMAHHLITLARNEDSTVVVTAQTLPQQGASTRVLQKMGFTLHDTVHHPEDGRVWEWRHDGATKRT
jgi:ribosomal-protein-alanine N-acetyltransferase